jgi:dTMP kinase
MTPNPHRGKLIVFEGLDGSGQTTQAQLLVKWFVEKRSQLAYYTKEPSDGPIGSLLKLTLTKRLGRLHETAMALCFAADRMDHLNSDVIPKLQDGIHIVADRYYLSSLAYQSVMADYSWILEINKHALCPDLTFFLDVPAAVCVKRMQAQRWHVELYEDIRTLTTVHQNFMQSIQKRKLAGERIEILDGGQPVRDVHRMIVSGMKTYLKSLVSKDKKGQSDNATQLKLLMDSEPLTEAEIATHQEG